MRRFIEGAKRGQPTLLPECLDDWVDENNPVCVVDAFVDALDLARLGFESVGPVVTGRPGYHLAALLKFYIYGYLNRIQSSRRLEREARRNLEVICLLRRLSPDDKTIADFRCNNGPTIKKVCAKFVELCRQTGLLTKACIAIDGSKFKAVNARDKNFTVGKVERRRAQLEESVSGYLAQLDTADLQEPAEAIVAKTSQLKDKLTKIASEIQKLDAYEKEMLASPDQRISLTDPDGRSMATSRRSGVVGNNVQTAVDTEHHFIIAHEITNSGSDRAQLANMGKQAKAVLGVDNLEAVADRGYYSCEEIKACEDAGIAVTLPKPLTSGMEANGKFGESDFVYLADVDAYRCSAGEALVYHSATGDAGRAIRRYYTTACKACSLEPRCTTVKNRVISRWEHEHVMEAAQKRLDADAHVMRRRRETVEHPFGTLKMRMTANRLTRRASDRMGSDDAVSKLPTSGERVDLTLGLRSSQAILGLDLLDEIIVVLEVEDLLHAKLAPLVADFSPHPNFTPAQGAGERIEPFRHRLSFSGVS